MASAQQTSTSSPTRSDWIGLWVLALALAMVVLDCTIVGVALPVIISDLDLTLPEAQWIHSLYSVVFAALLLTFRPAATSLVVGSLLRGGLPRGPALDDRCGLQPDRRQCLLQ